MKRTFFLSVLVVVLICSTTFFLLFAVQTAWAQTPKTIEGIAIESKGIPLP